MFIKHYLSSAAFQSLFWRLFCRLYNYILQKNLFEVSLAVKNVYRPNNRRTVIFNLIFYFITLSNPGPAHGV